MNKRAQKIVSKMLKAVAVQGAPDGRTSNGGVVAAKPEIMAIVKLATAGLLEAKLGAFRARIGEDVDYAEVAVQYGAPEYHSVLSADSMKKIAVMLTRATAKYNAWAKQNGRDECEAVFGVRPGSNNRIYVGVTFNPTFK